MRNRWTIERNGGKKNQINKVIFREIEPVGLRDKKAELNENDFD